MAVKRSTARRVKEVLSVSLYIREGAPVFLMFCFGMARGWKGGEGAGGQAATVGDAGLF